MAIEFRVPRQSQRITAARRDPEPDLKPDVEDTSSGAVEVISSSQPATAVSRVTVTSSDPAAGLSPTDVEWGGVIRIRRSWREVAWPIGCVTAPPMLSLGVWLATSDPVWLVGTGTGALALIATADHVRHRLGISAT